MPEPSSDPEKYTIDEMMERLRERDSSGKSELVTRSDGSQAMKVRRRKRRSDQTVNQETKRNQRIQVAQIAGFVLVVVLVVLAAGIGVLYANSGAFRESLLSKLEDSSGAKVSLTQFRMNPATANANTAIMEWPEGNALENLSLSTITAKIAPTSFLGNSFTGEEVVAAKGALLLRAPVGLQASRYKPDPAGTKSVKFQRYSIPSLDILFGNAAGTRRFLKGTEASFFPSTAAGQAEVRLRGGLFEFDAWPPMALDRSYIKVSDGTFQIQSLRFIIPKGTNDRRIDKGFINFSGTVTPMQAVTTHRLDANVGELRLQYLLGTDLGQFFVGNVDSKDTPSSNFLTFSPDSLKSSALELTLTNSLDSRIDLGGFKFLSQLAVALDDRWYELPNFNDNVTMVIKRRGGDVAIGEINLVSRGRMVVRGSVSNSEAGGISGSLRIGLPEATVAASPNKRMNILFGEMREGYRWLNIEIGGTSAVPRDNFQERYNNAAETPVGESAIPVVSPDRFDDLIKGGK